MQKRLTNNVSYIYMARIYTLELTLHFSTRQNKNVFRV
jgi:hypothetical protein